MKQTQPATVQITTTMQSICRRSTNHPSGKCGKKRTLAGIAADVYRGAPHGTILTWLLYISVPEARRRACVNRAGGAHQRQINHPGREAAADVYAKCTVREAPLCELPSNVQSYHMSGFIGWECRILARVEHWKNEFHSCLLSQYGMFVFSIIHENTITHFVISNKMNNAAFQLMSSIPCMFCILCAT